MIASIRSHAASVPLFEDYDPIDVTIEADFKLINTPNQTGAELGLANVGKGMLDPKYFASAGVLSYKNEAGENIEVEITVSPRGMSRRETCEYKPLDIRFNVLQTEGIFANTSRSLEVVTHCQGSNYAAVYAEYFAYRSRVAFGVPSFQVRRVNFRYIDTGGKFKDTEAVGFFIESKKNMGKRLGLQVLDLTDEEENVASTQEEKDAVSYFRSRYGDYIAEKFIRRMRLYKKYEALSTLVPMKLEAQFLQFLAPFLFRGGDVHPRYLINTFPVQFSNSSVTLVDYDFDHGYLPHGFDASELPAFFDTYARSLGFNGLSDYIEKRKASDVHTDQADLIAALEYVVRIYKSEELEEELAAFKEKDFDSSKLLKSYKDTFAAIETFLNKPDFGFLKPQ